MTALPTLSTGPTRQDPLAALLTSVAAAPLSGSGWLRVTGEDRVRWLNGMLTNSIATLAPGEAVYNFALSAQGRIQADAIVFALADELRIQSNRATELMVLLDRFIIMDDIELTSLTSNGELPYDGLLLAGPDAAALLTRILGEAVPEQTMRLRQTLWQGKTIDLVHAHSPLIARYELWSDAATIARFQATCLAAGAVPADAAALEDLRLLEGTPLYGTDIRDKELPQETAFPHEASRALHFSKGCYLGQEIVERIHSRGSVHRTLAGFQLTGKLPLSGTPLFPAAMTAPAAETQRPIGEITSARTITLADGPIQLALGYIRRDALERNETITYPGGHATPITLPLFAARSKSAHSG